MIVFSRSVLARALAAPAFALALAVPPHALAQGAATATSSYSIAAGPLEDSLNRFGRTAGITLSFAPEMTAGLRSGGLQGSHTLEEGLRHLLAGSGVEALRQPNGSYLLRRVPPAEAARCRPCAKSGYRPASMPICASCGRPGRQRRARRHAGQPRHHGHALQHHQLYLRTDREPAGARLMDVLENDPSVRSSAPIDSEADIVMVRGFEMFGREVMIDGLGGLADNRAHVLESVDRVEALKGPSALLNSISPWGSSTGGSINYVLKRAEDTPTARFTGSYASSSKGASTWTWAAASANASSSACA